MTSRIMDHELEQVGETDDVLEFKFTRDNGALKLNPDSVKSDRLLGNFRKVLGSPVTHNHAKDIA